MWSFLAGIIEWALKWFFGGKQQQAGEELGKVEAQRDAAVTEVNEDAQSSQARSDAIAADAGDGVRKPHPGDRAE